MEYLLITLGCISILVGIVGCVLPALPGLPLCWLGLVLVYFSPGLSVNYVLLGITLVITLGITCLDYIIPAKGTKRFGGSKYGVWGTNIGLLAGLFFVPWGIVVGPFAGALLGELIFDRTNQKRAFKAAFGAFLGFLAGTFMKIMVGVSFLVLFGYVVIANWKELF